MRELEIDTIGGCTIDIAERLSSQRIRGIDKVAAMACTLSGAYNGVDAIPAYYRDKNNLEFYSELMELSRLLWKQND